MKISVPPVLVALITLVIIVGVNRLLSDLNNSFPGQEIVQYIFIGFGALFLAAASFKFGQLKTTTDPMNPSAASALAVTGVYGITRNPIYLGFLLMLTGFAVEYGNPVNIVPLTVFFWFITEFQIKPEEEALREKFGTEYDAYCQRTRRWL